MNGHLFCLEHGGWRISKDRRVQGQLLFEGIKVCDVLHVGQLLLQLVQVRLPNNMHSKTPP